MGSGITSWQDVAGAKFQAISDSIPHAWKLSSVASSEENRDVTGSTVTENLSQYEVEITESDAVQIVAKTSSGQWKAVDVANAFCHRASLAHQLVRHASPFIYARDVDTFPDKLPARDFL